MAYTLQLSDVRSNLGIQSISGVCHDSAQFAEQVNTVTRRLMQRGEWHKTSVLMRLCFQGCRIVWPRQVGTILGAKFCCGGFMQIKNSWWAVAGYGSDGWCGDAVMRDDNERPCQNEVTGNTGKIIRLHIVNNKDIGKTLKIFGTRYGNQPLQQQLPDGNWEMGLTITAAQTDASTTVLVTRIDEVVKQNSQGRFFLYEVEPDTTMLLLSTYEPGETNPSYRTSVIQNVNRIPGNADAYGRCIRQIEALVKLEFVPAKTDNDFVMLDNVDALELGIAGLRAERKNDDVLANIKYARAIQELNMELRNRNPSPQTVIRTNDLSQSYSLCNPI